MIGHVSLGKSFYHCISYVLEDKQHLSAADKLLLQKQDGLQHQNRAEILSYNQCFGNKKELSIDFNDVAKLSRRTEKPVLHLSFRPAPGETISKNKWMEIADICAKQFDIAGHQYLCVLHNDTAQQHLHIVANRVGFDGKAASSSNNFKKMVGCCRHLEKQFNLESVLSPRNFLPKEQKLAGRYDERKARLYLDIKNTLEQVNSYSAFEQEIRSLGYRVTKARGIAFTDDKKVKTKGSEVGFSLAKIEEIIRLHGQLNMLQEKRKSEYMRALQNRQESVPSRVLRISTSRQIDDSLKAFTPPAEKVIMQLLQALLKPVPGSHGDGIAYTPDEKKKKRHRGFYR